MEIWISFIGAIIVALISLVGVVITAKSNGTKLQTQLQQNNDKIQAELDKHNAVQDERITELTREVRLHNNFAERIPVIEQRVVALEHNVYKK